MNTPIAPAADVPATFTRYQIFVIALLTFVLFTVMLDFMILAPLGPILMQDLSISTAHFGWAVSIYAYSAGASGLLAAGFADRFDRKKMLLFFYVGFLVGTVFCGLAPTYPILLAARLLTGLFGGVIGSIVMTIVADLFPLNRRGRVMGFLQTAFAASQVLGLPLGIYLSNHWGWHAPFLMIALVGGLGGLGILAYLRPLTGHLQAARPANPFGHLFKTVTRPRYLQGFAATTLLATGGFMLMPFASAFTVHNMGIPYATLPTIYLVTGLCMIFAGPLAGKLSDSFGKFTVFAVGTLLSMGMVFVYTRMGLSPLWWVIVVNVALYMGISSRMIPSQALMSAVPDAPDRGSYMSVNASIQQIAGGIAASVSGLIVVQTPSGRLEHYDTLGYVVMGAMALTLGMMYTIHRSLRRRNLAGV